MIVPDLLTLTFVSATYVDHESPLFNMRWRLLLPVNLFSLRTTQDACHWEVVVTSFIHIFFVRPRRQASTTVRLSVTSLSSLFILILSECLLA